jgi:hypothetical protein
MLITMKSGGALLSLDIGPLKCIRGICTLLHIYCTSISYNSIIILGCERSMSASSSCKPKFAWKVYTEIVQRNWLLATYIGASFCKSVL